MASGHVNRIKRPNTWLHRPMLQKREKSSCQLGAVHTWHIASFRCAAEFSRYRGIADSGEPSARQREWPLVAPRPVQRAGHILCRPILWIAPPVCPDLIYNRHSRQQIRGFVVAIRTNSAFMQKFV
jgi:hypothetical protein